MNGEEHRLAAILFADIVGYSLMPERVALQFRKNMLDLIREILPAHHGRLVKSQGDDILAEFSSATDALGFAVALQQGISDQNAAVGLGQRFRLRIGIHAGEVVVDGADILGDAVNTAKRAESLAAPGGICLTESVWQQVHEQLPHSARRLGRVSTKHLKLPLLSYHIDPPGAGLVYRMGHRFRLGLARPGRLALLLLLGGVALWAAVVLTSLGDRLLPPYSRNPIERAQYFLERYDKEGYVQRAVNELARIPGTDPQIADAEAYLAMAYWRRYKETGELKTRTEADKTAEKSIAAIEEIPVSHHVQGLVAMDRADWIGASNALFRANTLERGENGVVLLELAMVCQQLHDPAKVEQYLRQAKEVHNKNWDFHNELAKYEYRRGNDGAAITNALEAIRLAPRNSIAECNLANFYITLSDGGNHEKQAWEHLEKARKYRTTAVYYSSLGQYYIIGGRPKEAFDSFWKAAQLKPKDYRFWGTAGLTLMRAKRPLEAAEYLTNAISKAQAILFDTKDCLVVGQTGLYHAALGHATEALAALKQALADCPENSQVHEAAVAAAGMLGDLGKGKEAEDIRRLLDPPGKSQ